MQAVTDNVFRALADPTRRAIFERLARDGEQTVHALTDRSGVSQPAVSKHLTVLKRAKLVRHRRQGRARLERGHRVRSQGGRAAFTALLQLGNDGDGERGRLDVDAD
jgi:DNA-binding transcriptional ArsR family regulator